MKQHKKFQKRNSGKQQQKRQQVFNAPKQDISINKNKIAMWLLLISIATAIVYLPTFKNGVTNWDDDSYVTNNPWHTFTYDNLKSAFSSYYMGNYHPLAMLSLGLDKNISGLNKDDKSNTFMFHFSNLLFHIINTLLIFWLIFIMLQRSDIAIITALLFGLGAIHVESVAWLSERKDVLYSCFFIASMVSYVYYVKRGKFGFYIGAFLLFVLSLLSKGQAVSLAVSLIAIDFFMGRNLTSRKVILEKVPFFILALIFGLIAIKAQKAGNALHTTDSYEFYKRIGFAGYAFTQYLIKLIIPANLAAIYPYPDIINKDIPNHYWLFLIPSLLFAYAFFYSFKRNKLISFCIAFFIINIALLLQLLPVGSAILADRYSYIPSIGIHLLSAYFIAMLIDKKSKYKTLIYSVLAIYLVVMGIASFNRCMVWENSTTLWDDTINKSPKAVVAWNNRGSEKDRMKDHKGAIEDFTRAIVLKPDYTHAFYNRGTSKKAIALEKNDSTLLKSAIEDFNKSIEFDKKLLDAYHNRGLAYESLSGFARTTQKRDSLLLKALDDYNTTISINPNHQKSLINRGVIRGKLKMLDSAIVDFNRAIKLQPDNASAYSNRGLAKDHMGNDEGAIADYTMAIEKDSSFSTAYLNRGIIYRRQQKLQAANADFTRAIELEEDLAAAYYFRALNYLQENNQETACGDLKRAAELGHQNAILQYKIYCLARKK